MQARAGTPRKAGIRLSADTAPSPSISAHPSRSGDFQTHGSIIPHAMAKRKLVAIIWFSVLSKRLTRRTSTVPTPSRSPRTAP